MVLPFVEAGYIVAAVQHHDLPGPQMNHWNRALDLTFTLDSLLSSELAASIDQERIGAAGFSAGGLSVLWLSGAITANVAGAIPDEHHTGLKQLIDDAKASYGQLDTEALQKDYRDPRVKAAFVMAPAWVWLAYDEGLSRIAIPLSIVAGSADEVVVTKTNAERLAQLVPGSTLTLIPDAGHLVFIGEPRGSHYEAVPRFLYEDPAGVERQYIQQKVEALAHSFFEQNARAFSSL